MKIGILQTGHAPDQLKAALGDYDDMFQRLLDGHGFEYQTFNVVDMEFPDSADATEGWIVTGSKHGAYEDQPWIAPLEQLIRNIHAAKRPMLGICFGHQIIAQAMGGKVEKFQGGWSVGATDYDYKGQRIALNAWHQDQVTELPEGAKVIASNDFCEYAAMVYGDTIWTIQPHPEFDTSMIEGLATTRGPGVVPDEQLDAARENLSKPIHSATIADEMAAFLKKGAV